MTWVALGAVAWSITAAPPTCRAVSKALGTSHELGFTVALLLLVRALYASTLLPNVIYIDQWPHYSQHQSQLLFVGQKSVLCYENVFGNHLMSLLLCLAVPDVIETDTVHWICMLDMPCRDDRGCKAISLLLLLGAKTMLPWLLVSFTPPCCMFTTSDCCHNFVMAATQDGCTLDISVVGYRW